MTDDGEGSSTAPAADELLDDTGLLICQGVALVVFAVSVAAFACICLLA
ncbi:MAG: hypothetical protein HQ446_01300 [Polaromonas sp.]|nr:hypothetical protein [Polaromonas sp.]